MPTKPESEPIPRLFEGGLSVDDRGAVGYVNDFNPAEAGVKRFYSVRNHRAGFVRAWHAHKKEAKYVTVLAGSAVVAAVKIDQFDSPSREAAVDRRVLSSNKPSVLYVPPGHANGFMTLTDDALLIFFSTATLDESRADDYRFDARYWDVWNVREC